MPKRRFNTTGPCVPDKHYMLPAVARLPEVTRLIEDGDFFVLHAARQSGKTTLLLELCRLLEAEGLFHALYVSLETAQSLDEPERGVPAILAALETWMDRHSELRRTIPPREAQLSIAESVSRYLESICRRCPKPLVVFFDEADCLGGETLILFLRQLRSGYVARQAGSPFPHSLALVGMRNIRDFRSRIRPDRDTLGSASPFNIASTALTMPVFSRSEVATLYDQHTVESGQAFPEEVVDRVYESTQGQPWLVNAIARDITERLLDRDASRPIETAYVDQVIEGMILRRVTHIDSLLERLKEERVRKIVEPVLIGEGVQADFASDDARYVLDLGLLTRQGGEWRAANPIYREVILRELSWNAQDSLPAALEGRWIRAGRLDMTGLLQSFQVFWRENAESWTECYDYKEAAPHLILMAYLQRVVNGGAEVIREYAAGRGRVDIDVRMADDSLPGGLRHYPLEIKLRRSERSAREGLEQLAAYCDRLGADEAWLVLFDRRPGTPWEEKLTWQTEIRSNRTLHLVTC